MIILFEDLEMWSKTSTKIYFAQAYERAKEVFQNGHWPIIDWVEHYDFMISKGRKITEHDELPKFKISHRLATAASRKKKK